MQPKPEVFLETNRLSQSLTQSVAGAIILSHAGWLPTGVGRNTLSRYICTVQSSAVQCILLIRCSVLCSLQLAPLGGLAGGLVDRKLAWSRAMVKSG